MCQRLILNSLQVLPHFNHRTTLIFPFYRWGNTDELGCLSKAPLVMNSGRLTPEPTLLTITPELLASRSWKWRAAGSHYSAATWGPDPCQHICAFCRQWIQSDSTRDQATTLSSSLPTEKSVYSTKWKLLQLQHERCWFGAREIGSEQAPTVYFVSCEAVCMAPVQGNFISCIGAKHPFFFS